MAVLLTLAAAGSGSWGRDRELCNIPVFRYALERWRSSVYEVIVFHRGPLEGEARAAVDELRKQPANVEVNHLDLASGLKGREKEIWDAQKSPSEPWMVALYPGGEGQAWAGPAGAEAVRALVDSPARRESSRRILTGETAVWLVLESGNKEKDDAALALVEPELRKLEKTLKLPAHGPDDPPLLSEVPVKIAFSTLRLARNDPAEKAFVQTLLPRDVEIQSPIVFPVFGRGRALAALWGEALAARTIEEAGGFLAGACACEVKEQNPGVDLLVALDWDQALSVAPPEEPKPIPIPVIPPRAAPASPKSETAQEGPRFLLWLAVGSAGILVLATGARALRRG